MTEDLDDIRAELARINEELAEVSSDDLSARLALRERQQELRTLARDSADLTGVDDLRRREQELRDRVEQLQRRRVSGASIGGGGGPGGGGIDPYQASEMNRAIDAGSGLAELRAELDRVRARLRKVEATES